MPGNRTEENHRKQDVNMTLDEQAHRFFDKSSHRIVKPVLCVCRLFSGALCMGSISSSVCLHAQILRHVSQQESSRNIGRATTAYLHHRVRVARQPFGHT